MVKKGKLDLILSIAAAVLAIVAFIGLALDFISIDVSGAENAKLGDWNDFIADGKKAKMDMGAWPASQAFMWITLILVVAVVALLVVRFFIDNKIMNIVTIAVSALALISAIVFVATFMGGMDKVYGDYPSEVKNKISAGAGVWLITIASIGSAICAGITGRKVK